MNEITRVLLNAERHADKTVDSLFQELRRTAGIQRHESDAYPPFWSIVRHSDVARIYTSPEDFGSTGGVLLRPRDLGSDPGGGKTLALTDPPRHGLLRRILAPRFSERCARELGQEMREDIARVLEEAASHDEVDFAHDVAGRLSGLLIARLIGVNGSDRDRVVGWIEEAFAAGIPMTSHQQLATYLIDVIYSRMESPADDAVGLLVDGEIEGEELSETEILLNCENLLGASENAGLSLAAGMETFLALPAEFSRLREDPQLIPVACEEVLRWASSATHSMRVTRREVSVGGIRIPPGERVVVWVRSANRDETVFDEPGEFRIDRRPNPHLALGTGEHVCIGQTVARHQMRYLLNALVNDVQIEQTGDSIPLASLMVSGPAHLPVRIRLR